MSFLQRIMQAATGRVGDVAAECTEKVTGAEMWKSS